MVEVSDLVSGQQPLCTGDLLLLVAPSSNRVYNSQASTLVTQEVRWVLGALGHQPDDDEVSVTSYAGISMVRIPAHGRRGGRCESASASQPSAPSPTGTVEASNSALPWLARLSSIAGAFIVEDPRGPLLRPVELPRVLHHSDDLESTLKYPGKTNEHFTALVLNLAMALSGRREHVDQGDFVVLDPMAGRGTTLNRALRLGLSPQGIEIDAKDVEAYTTFLSTWLKNHRYKHTLSRGKLTRHRTVLGTRCDASFAASKADAKAGRQQSVTLLGCDTVHAADLLPARSIDALVVDLPYGVQHGSRTGKEWKRSPVELVATLAPGWRNLLRASGAIAVAINRRTTPFDDLRDALCEAGFEVLSRDGTFRHRVDQSIDRDVVLAIPHHHPERERLTALAETMTVVTTDQGEHS